MIKKSLITAAVGGVISIGGWLGFQFDTEQDCVKLADELQAKAQEQTLLPDEFATLKTINELGCGMLSENPVEIVKVKDIVSDGSEFIYFSEGDYKSAKKEILTKLKENKEFDWKEREPQKFAAILTYEIQKRGGVTLQGENLKEQVLAILLPEQ